MGVIAQDLQEIAPFMVKEVTFNNLDESYGPEDGEPLITKEDYLVVDPSAFDYLLVNSVNEQQAMIEKQGATILQLRDEMDELKGLIRDLSASLEQPESKDDAAPSGDNQLYQNEPNPFESSTMISYLLDEGGHVNLTITDINGFFIESLVDHHQEAGNYELNWDASNRSSGVYFYTLHQNGTILLKKMILIK